ncbi:MAG: uncharacterized protein JWN08_3696 [Frankiales bacterium]|nr:uncharacterized protein [Frankiales bacterium]
MTSAARPVARLTSPGEVVALVPVLCGFVPQESLVVVSLRGPRKQIGLTMRFDLDWAASDLGAAAAEVAERLELDEAARLVLVVFSSVPSCGRSLPWSDLVAEVQAACDPRGTAVDEALLVREGRWWSYVCGAQACCPAEGTPLATEPTAALRLVEAERVLEGRAVLSSRDELVASLATPVLQAATDAEEELDRALDAWLDRYHRDGREAVRDHGLTLARTLLAGCHEGLAVAGPEAAALAVAVQDVLVRDEIATWCLDDHDALLSVLLQVARLVVPPEDCAVLALLGWVAYAHGDGAVANVALQRCLASDPDHVLAQLLGEMLSRQVPPVEVRALLRATARQLRST